MIRVNRLEVFNRIQLDKDCHGCPNLRETVDMFGTGDSPTDFSCSGTCFDCPRVDDRVQEIEDWLSDHQSYVEVLEEIK